MLDLVLRRDRDSAAQSDVDKLATRVGDLERRPKPKAKDGWDLLQVIAAALSPLLLATLGFYFTGRVTNAINRRQLEVNTIKDMQPLVLQIVNAQSPDEARAAAVGLAAYGRDAIEPLRTLLRSPKSSVMSAAEEGLRSVGVAHPPEVCASVRAIFTDRSALYSWENHRTAIELTGQLQCRQSKPALEAYRRVLSGGEQSLARITAPNPPVDAAAMDTLIASVQNALKSVK